MKFKNNRNALLCIYILFVNLLSQEKNNQDPQILELPEKKIPEIVLKEGVEGSVESKVTLDTNGTVLQIEIVKGLSRNLDSLTVKSLRDAKFSPAIQEGKPVSSIVHLTLDYILDSMAMRIDLSKPSLTGVLLDSLSQKPIPFGKVIVSTDSKFDSTVKISSDKYLSLIGKIRGQKFYQGTIQTQTDSLGVFKLYALPNGPFILKTNISGYARYQYKSELKATHKPIRINLRDTLLKENEYEILVTKELYQADTFISIAEQEKKTGLSHSLNDVIQTQSVISRSSQSKAQLLVKSGTPFDNCYLVAGLPMYSPIHFSGFSYGEIDGLMIQSFSDIKITAHEIAGRFPSVSGALIEMNPGISISTNKVDISRPQLKLDFGMSGVDLMGTYKLKSKDPHVFQIGWNAANSNLLAWTKSRYGLSPNANYGGIGYPKTFGAFTVNDNIQAKNLLYKTFLWLAWDTYTPYDSTNKEKIRIPWGGVSFSLNNVDSLKPSLTVGGTRQYFTNGKRMGIDLYSNETYLSSGVLSLKYPKVNLGALVSSFEIFTEYREWYGNLYKFNDLEESIIGEESKSFIRGEFEFTQGAWRLKSNLLGSALFFPDAKFSIDPGISLYYTKSHYYTGISLGLVTAYPDFRGLPDSSFRKEQLRTYIASLHLGLNSKSWLNLAVTPYLRYQDRVPRINPLKFVWDSSFTEVYAAGADGSVSVNSLKWIDFNIISNFSHAYRNDNGSILPYEWESPFSFTGMIHVNTPKSPLHFYGSIQQRYGTKYFDLYTSQYKNLPVTTYYNLDLQYKDRVINHRFINRFDVYISAKNLLDKPVIRDYYYSQTMSKFPIVSEGLIFDFGVKASFRL